MVRILLIGFFLCLFVLGGCAAPNTPIPTSARTLPAPTSLPTPVPPTNAPSTALPSPTTIKTPMPLPTPTIVRPNVFTLKADAPVLAHSKPGVWPMQYIDPGAVVEHEGKFFMFFNGINGWPAPVQVGLATSDDGKTWTRQGSDPVFKADNLPYVGFTIFASSALVQPDGTWSLYFYALDETNFEKGGIGRATAKSPEGPWTADADLVLKPGEAGAWDSYQVTNPSVLRTDDGYVMYFAGGSAPRQARRIGMATSTDGIHWKKYKDPNATRTEFAASSPVLDLAPKPSWDDTRIFDANVVKNADGWVMVYLADKLQFSNVGVGIATSRDGIHWTRTYNSFVLAPTDVKNGNGMFLSNLLYRDDTYYLYFDVGRARLGTDVFMATRQGSIN